MIILSTGCRPQRRSATSIAICEHRQDHPASPRPRPQQRLLRWADDYNDGGIIVVVDVVHVC